MKNYVEMGWGAPAMKAQHPVLDEETAAHFDEDNKSISRMVIRGLITPSQADLARKKYVKNVEAAIKKALQARQLTPDTESR